MRVKSTRDKGNDLEQFVLNHIPTLVKTNNSGAVSDNGDLQDSTILVECKNNLSKESVSIPDKQLKKVKKQALTYLKDWVFINGIKSGVHVTMSFDLFLTLYIKYIEKHD